jgi:hypothetical protein
MLEEVTLTRAMLAAAAIRETDPTERSMSHFAPDLQ